MPRFINSRFQAKEWLDQLMATGDMAEEKAERKPIRHNGALIERLEAELAETQRIADHRLDEMDRLRDKVLAARARTDYALEHPFRNLWQWLKG